MRGRDGCRRLQLLTGDPRAEGGQFLRVHQRQQAQPFELREAPQRARPFDPGREFLRRGLRVAGEVGGGADSDVFLMAQRQLDGVGDRRGALLSALAAFAGVAVGDRVRAQHRGDHARRRAQQCHCRPNELAARGVRGLALRRLRGARLRRLRHARRHRRLGGAVAPWSLVRDFTLRHCVLVSRRRVGVRCPGLIELDSGERSAS